MEFEHYRMCMQGSCSGRTYVSAISFNDQPGLVAVPLPNEI